MVSWSLLLFALVATALLTLLILLVAPGQEWLDQPVARSAHTQPMPSAGGLAMVVPFLFGVGYLVYVGILDYRAGLIFGGCLGMTLTGLIDDIRNLSIRWRLAVQMISALWVLYWAGDLGALQLGSWRLEIPAVVYMLSAVAFVWLLNLYNFMDGIDGLAASEAGFVTLLAFLLILNTGDATVSSIALLLLAISAGFLIWNWPPARIFMGDVGSGFLGYSLAALAIVSIANGTLNPWVWLLMLGVFAVDATYTLCYRLVDRQRWYEGHNTHAYQHAARILGSHLKVNLAVLAINLLWLAPLAWLATQRPDLGLPLTVLGLFPLVVLARKLRAGSPGVRQLEST